MKDPPRCEDVADKLVRLFGWRQTYPVQKLQQNLLPKHTAKVFIVLILFVYLPPREIYETN
ncbi:unnamed protein product [Leptidea sinapis]|uniref:Uncharacterized protein n=1 Tax=Leptidea sinapis TaxID=189913 RepID=A0A5E4QHV6_9NEOP|nr:unnamed protein product [Leptidea sinapis]